MKLFAMRFAVLGLALAALPAGAAKVHLEEETGTLYEVKANNARMIRRVEGPVASSVQGVPAQPVDAFVHDGDPTGIEPLDDARFDLEVHLVFHDAPGPIAAGNFPPGFSFFYHLQFEDVKLEVKHAEAAPE